VTPYIRGMPRIRDLIASLNDPTLAGRVLATIAEKYAAQQSDDEIWVCAAAPRGGLGVTVVSLHRDHRRKLCRSRLLAGLLS
jgi:hypothetical protein